MTFDISPLVAEMESRIAEINQTVKTDPQRAKQLLARMEMYMTGYMEGFRQQVTRSADAITLYRSSLND